MLAAAATVAALLVGYPLTENPNTAGEPAADQGVLSPTTLKPRAPRVPAPSAMALSPDRSQSATISYTDDVLRFFRPGGKATGQIALPDRPGATLMSWLRRDRLLVFTCAGFPGNSDVCDTATVHVVDTVKHELVSTRALPRPMTEVSTAGRRALVMLRNGIEPTGVAVLAPNGRITHRVKAAGTLSGTLVSSAGPGLVSSGSPGSITRIDPLTGAISRVRRFHRTPVLVVPRPREVALIRVGESRYLQLDPRTLKTIRAFRGGLTDVRPMPSGYLIRGEETLTAYSLRGKELWSTPITYAEYAGIGDHVYVQRGLDSPENPNYRLDVYAARTGRRVAEIPGRYRLTTPSWSSFKALNGPLLDGGDLLYDDD